MKRKWWIFLILFLVVILIVWPKQNKKIEKVGLEEKTSITPTIVVEQNLEKYLVKKVIDGDTLTVEKNNKEETIRMIGINAPESNECGGIESAQKLKELVENKEIKIEGDETQDDKDVYGRTLRYIFVDGININQKMIADGWAKEYTYKVAYKYKNNFKETQETAKKDKRGIWGEDFCQKTIPTTVPSKVMGVATKNLDFVCDCSKSCTQIETCEEAYFQLNSCGCSVRDNDGDGVPCETLCR